jgi:hypothetical protein
MVSSLLFTIVTMFIVQAWRHDTQHNDTQHNDIQHYDTQHDK